MRNQEPLFGSGRERLVWMVAGAVVYALLAVGATRQFLKLLG